MKIPKVAHAQLQSNHSCVLAIENRNVRTKSDSYKPQKKIITKNRRLHKNHDSKILNLTKCDSFSTIQNSNFLNNNQKYGKCPSTMIHILNSSTINSQITREHIPFSEFQPIKEGFIDEQCMPNFQTLELRNEIYQHLLTTQNIYKSNIILTKRGCTQQNRDILIKWIFQLSARLMLKNQTIFLCANIVDRALGKIQFTNEQLPLLGITALFMAVKYEEINCPKLPDLVSVLSAKYNVTTQNVLILQGQILIQLDFNLNFTSPTTFVCFIGHLFGLSTQLQEQTLKVTKQLIIDSHYKHNHSRIIAFHAFQVVFQNNSLISIVQDQQTCRFEIKDLKQKIRSKLCPQY